MRNILSLATFACLCATAGLAAETVIVRHGATPQPVYLDLGDTGESAGDQRIFAFDGQSATGQTVAMKFILTTTTIEADGTDTRMTDAVFAFSGDASGSLIVAGLGIYPGKGSTVKLDSTLERAVVGGTGVFGGARGTVVSTHLPDGTWEHAFNLQ